jgi:hypothetical protein
VFRFVDILEDTTPFNIGLSYVPPEKCIAVNQPEFLDDVFDIV